MNKSAGILAYRRRDGIVEVFLVHPGGPFWVNKDTHAWSMPKGEFTDEPALEAARREFEEETGQPINGEFIALKPVRSGSKTLHVFAVESETPEPGRIRSNTFEMEWPPGTGRKRSFPEVDRAAWFPLAEAAEKLHKNQQALLAEFARLLSDTL